MIKKEELIRDINKYNIDILDLAVQETNIKGISELEQINNYTFYKAECDNSHHGVGFIVKKNNIKCNFTGISNRIAKLKVFHQYNERNTKPINLICAYAPTSDKKYIQDTEQFYIELENILNNVNKKEVIILCGDFNSKIGSANEKISKYSWFICNRKIK